MPGTRIELLFGDGTYSFQLRGAQIEELQLLCGTPDEPVGIGTISTRLFNRTFFRKDVRETIRLGLIGGGTAAVRALQIVQAYVDDCPMAKPGDPASPLSTAQAIMSAAFFGWEAGIDDAPKKEAAAASPSTSPPSKPTGSRSDGPRARSRKATSPRSTLS